VARGGLGAAGSGRHLFVGGTLLTKNKFRKEFESSSFSLLFLNNFFKILKVVTLKLLCLEALDQ